MGRCCRSVRWLLGAADPRARCSVEQKHQVVLAASCRLMLVRRLVILDCLYPPCVGLFDRALVYE